MNKFEAYLGEICIARGATRSLDGKWQIESPQAACKDILRGWLGDQVEAEACVEKLVPPDCRLFVRFFYAD